MAISRLLHPSWVRLRRLDAPDDVGLFFLFFLALGGFSFDGLIHQVNNMTSRYVVADAARTGAFLNMFAIAHMILSAAIITFRRDRILPDRKSEGGRHHG